MDSEKTEKKSVYPHTFPRCIRLNWGNLKSFLTPAIKQHGTREDGGINSVIIGILIIALVTSGGAGYWYGLKNGFRNGYVKAEADIKKSQEEISKAMEDKNIRESDIFKIDNPFKNVEVDPFKKIKQILNPFEE